LLLLKKKISASEKKWGFVQLPVAVTSKLPKEFEISNNEKMFQLKINSKNRIVSRKLFHGFDLHVDDTIELKKIGDNYSIVLTPKKKIMDYK